MIGKIASDRFGFSVALACLEILVAFRRLALIAISVALVLSVGCRPAGDGRLPVSGTVTWDGESLDGGMIVFVPIAEGRSSSGKVIAGEFDLPSERGLPPGEYRVEITLEQETGKQRVFHGDGPDSVSLTKQVIPKRYNQESTLILKVDKPPVTANFELNK